MDWSTAAIQKSIGLSKDLRGKKDDNVEEENVYCPVSTNSPLVKQKPRQSNYWVPSCASHIKIFARAFSCESMEELKNLKAHEPAHTEYFSLRLHQLWMEEKELWTYKMMEKLVAFVPYIEGREYSVKEEERLLWAASAQNLVQCEDYYSRDLIKQKFSLTVEKCSNMFKAVEGDKMFHPLIRMGHKDDLLKLISLSKRARKICKLEVMQMNPKQLELSGVDMDRPYCLPRSIIERFFAEKRKADKECIKAKERVSSVRRFESHLTSIDLEKVLEEKMGMGIMNKDTNNLETVAGKLAEDAEIVPEEYRNSIDDEDLIKKSLEERLFFVQMYARLEWCGSWLYELLEEKCKKGDGDTMTDSLIRSRGGVRFFECTNEYKEEGSIDQSVWEEKEVRDFIQAVEKEAFPDLPMHYVVRGILDYCDYLKKREEYLKELEEKKNKKDFPEKCPEEICSSIEKKNKDFLDKCHKEIGSSIWQQIDSIEKVLFIYLFFIVVVVVVGGGSIGRLRDILITRFTRTPC